MKTASIISKEPQLLQLTCWFETGLKSATTVTVQVGSSKSILSQEHPSFSRNTSRTPRFTSTI